MRVPGSFKSGDMTDVIGLAGFDYNFNALVEGKTNELAMAFQDLLSPRDSVRLSLPTSLCY